MKKSINEGFQSFSREDYSAFAGANPYNLNGKQVGPYINHDYYGDILIAAADEDGNPILTLYTDEGDAHSIALDPKYLQSVQALDRAEDMLYNKLMDHWQFSESRVKRYTIVSPSRQALKNKKLQESKSKVVRPTSATERAIKESIYSRSYAKPGKVYSPSYNTSAGNAEDQDVDYTKNFKFTENMKKIKVARKRAK